MGFIRGITNAISRYVHDLSLCKISHAYLQQFIGYHNANPTLKKVFENPLRYSEEEN